MMGIVPRRKSAMCVTLEKPIRGLILYATVVAAESGNIYFLDDVYGHDRRLEESLGSEEAGKQGSAETRTAHRSVE